jgi:anaerobic magnesium-protoporphyrin IX monomethyl ester cyclase
MRVVLIHPYVTALRPNVCLNEPLGLVCLATYLKDMLGDAVSVDIIDLYVKGDGIVGKPKGDFFVVGIHDEGEIAALLREARPDIVGITCNFTAYSADAFEVAAITKKYIPDVPVVLGGAHVSLDATKVLRDNPSIDYVVCGEGEITLLELVRSYIAVGNTGINMIEGLAYRSLEGEIVCNPKRPPMPSIEELPIPDRKYLDIERYDRINRSSLRFTKRKPTMNVITSRGCPFDCVFCSTKVMWERLWRANSAEKVVREIEILVDDYGVREIVFQDDQFLVDKRRVHTICDLIIERKLDVTLSLPAGGSIWLMDHDLLSKMKNAGFYRICFPIETGNQRSLDFIRKPIDLREVREKIQMANSLGYWTQGNFILGFPYETREEIEQTIRYAYASGLDHCNFFIAKPYAGAEMYDVYKKEGLLNDIVRASHIERSDYDTTTLSAEELSAIRGEAEDKLITRKLIQFLNPINLARTLLPKLRSIEDLMYALVMLTYSYRRRVRDQRQTTSSVSYEEL